MGVLSNSDPWSPPLRNSDPVGLSKCSLPPPAPRHPTHTNESDFTESGPSTPEGRGQEMAHKGRGLLLFLAAQQGAACEISVPPPGIEPGAVKLLNPNQ